MTITFVDSSGRPLSKLEIAALEAAMLRVREEVDAYTEKCKAALRVKVQG